MAFNYFFFNFLKCVDNCTEVNNSLDIAPLSLLSSDLTYKTELVSGESRFVSDAGNDNVIFFIKLHLI